MGVKSSTLWYMSKSSNELDRKGISRDADNGASTVDPKSIPKVTTKQLLSYGEEQLVQMQNEQIADLAEEHSRMGNEEDKALEKARIRQTLAI